MSPVPPYTAIRAFDAASRHLSFKHAAEELAVTPTAISHQIRQLEKLCRVKLFKRGAKGVSLTSRGRAFATDLRPAIAQIERAYRSLTLSEQRSTVVLGAGPIIASRWLAPRLPLFAASHPEIDLQLLNSPTEIWRRAPDFDVAIVWGHGHWPGLSAEKLLEVSLAPVLTPELAKVLGPLEEPGDLLRAPLLHHRNNSEWTDWFQRANVLEPVSKGTIIEDTNVLVQAALSGGGVMLGVLDFLSDDIATGRLVCPFHIVLEPAAAYYLVTSGGIENRASATLRQWLSANASASQ
ncbi:MAG: LysR substrate-binding domain-containing protein [Boseongicola sp.]